MRPAHGNGRGRAAVNAAALVLALAVTTEARAGDVSIVALGDSLTSGYGLVAAEAFPARLEAALAAAGVAARVIDAGVSGDTTAGGLARLDWTLAGAAPDLVIVELGANDGLRGIDPASTRANLDAILGRLRERRTPVLLAGMLAPRNLGERFTAEFDAVYPELARRHGVPLYPFFLAGVAGEPLLNQADGMHPNAAGVRAIVERILPYVMQALGRT